MPFASSFVIDSTRWSCVVRCTRDGCHWRAVTIAKQHGYRLLSHHQRFAHGDWLAASYTHRSADGAS